MSEQTRSTIAISRRRRRPRVVRRFGCLAFAVLAGCSPRQESDGFDMAVELRQIAEASDPLRNPWDNEARLAHYNSLPVPTDPVDRLQLQGQVAIEFLHSGRSDLAVAAFQRMLESVDAAPELGPPGYAVTLRQLLGLAYLRLGEQENCIDDHVAAACILPFEPSAVHKKQEGARGAMRVFADLERAGGATNVTRYLLNVAAMAAGVHPDDVDTDRVVDARDMLGPANEAPFPRFADVAPAWGLDVHGLSGGGITEDFDGDGDLDVMVSSWGIRDQIRLFVNEGGRRFTEATESGGLSGLTGGLNMKHADYDNDGDFDVLVLRGAWLGEAGRHPNSLLRNDGGGRFVDVTASSGLLSYHPTQTAVWADFDGDGWLDLFIGNESAAGSTHPCELYINKRDGTFAEVASSRGVDLVGFVKGVDAGDYDNDGDPDLYLSRLGEPNILLRNDGKRFLDVTSRAGVANPVSGFPAWFFDYDQDGLLDLLALSYSGGIDVLADHILSGGPLSETPRLYHNRGDGTFEDVTVEAGLAVFAKTMGSNFGDLDADGYPDFYLGTGDPDLRMLTPNRMFRNVAGRRFDDVTLAGRFGHLQKGHAVSFADLDGDGDQDVHIVMGGAFSGDVYPNAVFENANEPRMRSIQVELSGTQSNRAGVGASLEARLSVDGVRRSVHVTVGTGGSFGANPHRAFLGIGTADTVDSLIVTWPWNGTVQVFDGLPAGQIYRIDETAGLVASRLAEATKTVAGGSEGRIDP